MQNKLDGEVLERLEHILLSHHGDPEFGAVVRPATPEAIFVALVDNLDAKWVWLNKCYTQPQVKMFFLIFTKVLKVNCLFYRLVKKLRLITGFV
jgi:hypothetical protein